MLLLALASIQLYTTFMLSYTTQTSLISHDCALQVLTLWYMTGKRGMADQPT